MRRLISGTGLTLLAALGYFAALHACEPAEPDPAPARAPARVPSPAPPSRLPDPSAPPPRRAPEPGVSLQAEPGPPTSASDPTWDRRMDGCHMVDGRQTCGDCVNDSDCPERQGCIFDFPTRSMVCRESDCTADTDCAGEQVCRPAISNAVGTDRVFRCMTPGTRTFAQECGPDRRGCTADLTCFLGLCTVPCARQDDPACPEGTQCERDRMGDMACQVTCELTGCPDGFACTSLGVCGRGPDCFADPSLCKAGEKCLRQSGLNGGGTWSFGCFERCSNGQGCSEGKVCGRLDVCFDACGPGAPPCPEGTRCSTVDDEHRAFGCRPKL